jgi:UDP-N-acetylglucosamine 3-dehydrogenase
MSGLKPRIGLVGIGSMGYMHLKLLASGELGNEAILAAACDVDGKALGKARELGVTKLYKDYDEMLEKEGLDAVIIATPPYLHREQAVKALRRNLYVLLEKPMGVTLEDALEIARHADNRLMIAFSLRYHGLYRKVKDYLTRMLGAPLMQWHVALGRIPPVPWITDKGKSGGMINENSIHVLYQFYWYAGKVRKVYARVWRITPNITIEDNSAITLVHEGGTVSILLHSWTASHRWRKWGLQAEKGTITCEGYLGGEYRVSHDGKVVEEGVYNEPIEAMYANQLRDFIEAVVNEWKPQVNEEDGVHIHKVVKAVHESSAKDEPIRVD